MDLVGGAINAIVSGLFTVVVTVMSQVVAPIVNGVIALFPDVTIHIYNINQFFDKAFIFLTCIYRWFLFTKPMFQILFLYFVVKFSVWGLSNAIRLSIRFYHVLVP